MLTTCLLPTIGGAPYRRRHSWLVGARPLCVHVQYQPHLCSPHLARVGRWRREGCSDHPSGRCGVSPRRILCGGLFSARRHPRGTLVPLLAVCYTCFATCCVLLATCYLLPTHHLCYFLYRRLHSLGGRVGAVGRRARPQRGGLCAYYMTMHLLWPCLPSRCARPQRDAGPCLPGGQPAAWPSAHRQLQSNPATHQARR